MKDTEKSSALLSDEAIIDLYWKRNERALDATDRKYGKYLFTIAYNIVHNELDCQECLNDTYLSTWNKIPPTKPSIFQAFLARIMRNTAISRYREISATKRVPSELITSLQELDDCLMHSSSVDEEFEILEICKILNSYLRSLPSRSEFIFVCRYYYADSISKIAKMLQLSENTIYRELTTIRNGLRVILEREGYANEIK